MNMLDSLLQWNLTITVTRWDLPKSDLNLCDINTRTNVLFIFTEGNYFGLGQSDRNGEVTLLVRCPLTEVSLFLLL